MKVKVVLLAGKGRSTNIIYHALHASYSIEKVIVEESESSSKMINRRVRRLGIVTVGGQVLFQVICVPILKLLSKKRKEEILSEENLDDSEIPIDKIAHVPSVNSKACRKLLKEIDPNIIVVNGTRIISSKVLRCTSAIFINTHAGITPKYRGVHGGYWALAQDDRANCGVTVHLVDEGIDTGSILYQGVIEPTHKDNFTTYPLLQIAKGIPFLKMVIEEISQGKLNTKDPMVTESHLWYHPTIWYYLYKWVIKGVR